MEPVNVHQEFRVTVFLHYLPDNSTRPKDTRKPYSATAYRLGETDATIGWGMNPREAMLDAIGVSDSLLHELRQVHEASKGKGDQGAFDVWNAVANLLGEDAR